MRDKISHYRLIKKVGQGGMGEVYLAEDERLGRQVALKFLPASCLYDPKRRTRFLREARAASSLRSPNIAAIFDIGETADSSFIVMEYVEGETLAQKLKTTILSPRQTIEIATQIADALDEAHSHGMVHRDIKSSNVIVNSRGLVKVLDFGLVKLLDTTEDQHENEASEVSSRQNERTDTLGDATTAGLVVGTVPYMSPEQALGSTVDLRSDIFSLGVVMYEMLTGRLPFEGGNTSELIDRIVHDHPVAINRLNYSVPVELERIVRKCLDKDSSRRYQSARDLLIDLHAIQREIATETLAGNTKPRTKSRRRPRVSSSIQALAILPISNASGEPDADYLSDGITESIIKNLSQLPKLKVMASSTVFRYKGREVDPKSVGAELGVRAVLTGRLMLRGDTLIIKTELVDVEDGSQLWGEHYNRTLSDVFAVEEEISREISSKLRLKLTREQKKKLGRRHTQNTDAYQTYLKGRFYWNKRTEEGLRKGIEHFRQAIEIDPNYALAYAGLADSYNMLGSYSSLAPSDAFPKAKAAATRALEIDDTLPEAHASRAFVALAYDWDWDAAEAGFQRAISLDPGYASAHHWYGLYLMSRSRRQEAFAEIERAQELEPLSLAVSTSVGWMHYLDRQYERAVDAYLKTLDLEPTFGPARRRLGQAYLQLERFHEAIVEIERVLATVPDDIETLAALGHAYAVAGRIGEAREVGARLRAIEGRKYVPAFFLAKIHAVLGERDEALALLEKAYQERYGILSYIRMDPAFDTLQADPRLKEIIDRMNLY